MSSPTDISETISEFSSLYLVDHVELAAAVLMIYDVLITLDREIETFWKRKINGATILFFMNRHVFLLYTLATVASDIPTDYTDQSCTVITQVIFALGLLPYCVWAAFSALRAFALSRNLLASGVIFLLSIVPIGINISQYWTGLAGVVIPMYGCTGTENATLAMARGTCIMAADVILIYITWTRLFATRRIQGGLHDGVGGLTFSGVILRDGTIYFAVLLVLNSLHLTFTMLSIDFGLQQASVINRFTEPMTAILVARFLFDLQSAERQAVCSTSLSGGQVEAPNNLSQSLVFERVVASLGSSFVTGGGNGEDTNGGPAGLSETVESLGDTKDHEVDADGGESTGPTHTASSEV